MDETNILANQEALRRLVKSIDQKVDEAARSNHANDIVMARISMTLDALERARIEQGHDIRALSAKVAVLESTDQFRRGERGAVGEVMRSPLLAWLAAIAAAVWAWVNADGKL